MENIPRTIDKLSLPCWASRLPVIPNYNMGWSQQYFYPDYRPEGLHPLHGLIIFVSRGICLETTMNVQCTIGFLFFEYNFQR